MKSSSGLQKTNPASGREEDLNPGPPGCKSSALTTRPRRLHGVKSRNKATFSPVQYCHSAEGGLYPEGAYNRIFCFQVGGPITGRAYKQGGGGGGGGGGL